MWRNYLTVGVRALAKNKTYAFINCFGLAVGMAACLLILLHVREQLSFDRFFPDAERTYQLQAELTDPETGNVQKVQMAPYATVRAFASDFAEVELASYATNAQPIMLKDGEAVQRTHTLVDRDFFKLFPVRFLQGSAASALSDPNSIVLSRRSAEAMFGTASAVGRTITISTGDGPIDLRVSAVFEDLPRNSHQAFGMVRLHQSAFLGPGEDTQWGWFSGQGYFRLKSGADVAAVNARIDDWAKRKAPVNLIDGRNVSQSDNVKFRLVALPDVYLSGAGGSPSGRQGDRTTIYTFAIVALLILVIACVNFVNLATARASQRAREVSLRKVLGATRRQLVIQFLGETVLIAGVSMLIALAMVELALPHLRQFLNAELPMTYFGAEGVLIPAVALVLLVGVAGGLYPAFYLTRFQPALVLKANKSAADTHTSGRLRSILVVGQFAISIGLIICTAVVYSQILHARSTDPGFRRSGILQVENLGRSQVAPLARTLEREVGRIEGVQNVALTQIGVDTNNRSNQSVTVPGRDRSLTLGAYSVGFNFFETMGMKPLAGRTLQESQALDDATTPRERDDAAEQALVRRGINVIVNESSARQMGFRTPAEALGKTLRLSLVDLENGTVPATIVGVVADTRFRNAREEVEDIIYFHNANYLSYMEVAFDTQDPTALRDRIEAVWKRVVPQVPFDADFGDARAAAGYQQDEAVGRMFAGFALLAVVIACLGLFGLAAFTAERRTKEIGIRKVLGARSRDIVQLLAWQFSKPVIVANLIAWPAAWWVMRDWLNGFDSRIALTPLPFVVAGLVALVIAIGTISGHAAKVARANPIRALRYE